MGNEALDDDVDEEFDLHLAERIAGGKLPTDPTIGRLVEGKVGSREMGGGRKRVGKRGLD